MSSQRPVRVIIAGAAGRDFHDFNTVFRNDESHHVVAFTATQIPTLKDASIRRRCRGHCIRKVYPFTRKAN